MPTKHAPTDFIRALAAAVQAEMPAPRQEKPFGLGAPWMHHATPEEFERLARLHSRILRKELALAALRQERAGIMRRSIRRMRRAAGKD